MPRFDTPLNTSDLSLDRVLNAGLPVALVLTNGNGPDAALDAALREIARVDAGALLVARLDTHENPLTARRLDGARLVTFRDGQEYSRADTLTPDILRAHVDYALGRGPRPASQPAQPRTAPRAATPVTPLPVSDATFQREVLESDLPVLVDLWAPWCGPCHMIAPIVDRVAGEYAGRLKVVKLNVDDNPRTAGAYQVQGIPTLLIFRNGRVADRIVGAAPEPLLKGKIDAVLRR